MSNHHTVGGSTRLTKPLGSQAVGQVIALTSGMAAVALLARRMDTVEYGHFLAAWAIVTVCATLARSGLTRSLVREVPMALARGDRALASGLGANGWLITTVAAAAWSPVIVLLTVAFVGNVGWLSSVSALILALTWTEALRIVGETLLRAVHWPVWSQVFGSPLRGISFLVFAGWALTLDTLTFEGALGGLLAANVLVSVASFGAFACWKGPTRGSRRLGGLALVKAAPALFLLDVAAALLTQGDTMVASAAIAPERVAGYALAVRCAAMCAVPGLVVVGAFAPRMAHLLGRGLTAEAIRLSRRGGLLTLAGAAVLAAVYVALGPSLLVRIFGPAAESTYPLGVILSLGVCLYGPVAFDGLLLILNRMEGRVLAIMATAAVYQMAVGYFAAVEFGGIGLALVSASATAAQGVLLTIARRRAGLTRSHATNDPLKSAHG